MYAFTTEGYSSSNVQTGKPGLTKYVEGLAKYEDGNPIGYIHDVIQYSTGRVDYVIGFDNFFAPVITEQPSGWSVNWELVNIEWDTIDNIWEL